MHRRSRIGVLARLALAAWIALSAAGPSWNGTMAGPVAAIGTLLIGHAAPHAHGHDLGHRHDHDDVADAGPFGDGPRSHDHGPLDHLHDAVMTAAAAPARQPARAPPLHAAGEGLPPGVEGGLERPPRRRG